MTQGAGRALVTGGAGFLGPHLIEKLLRSGYCVLAIDNLCNGRREHLDRFFGLPQFEFVHGDITDGDFLAQTVTRFQPDAAFHLAALHFIPYCAVHPADTLRTNVIGTQLLLDAAKGTPMRSFILASTADVYVASELSHTEDQVVSPANIYGASKIAGEHLLRLASIQNPEVRFFCARFSNLFGPGETNPHVLPEILNGVKRGSVLNLGNLQPRRDYIYISDVADALLKIAAYRGEHRVFNISTGRGSSVLDLVHVLEGLIGRELHIEVDPSKVRRIERMSLVLDNSLIRRELDWIPGTSLEEGLRRTLAAEVSEHVEPAQVPLSEAARVGA